MLEINEKRGLGLERTVQWCVDNIDNMYSTSEILSKFGIRVIDNLPNRSELLLRYPPATYEGEFGNAVLVGTATPYDYYIWTRQFPDQVDPENPVNGEWLNIGQFPLPGPKGDTGATGTPGARGQRGSRIYTGQGAPSLHTSADTIEGDLYINTVNANLYQAVANATGLLWVSVTSLRGPQGEDGADGAQGPAGPVVDLVGKFPTVRDLPPVEIALAQYGRQVAFLIGEDGTQKKVYGLIGPDNNLSWDDLGLFAAGTLVNINGTPQETIDMSNYVPKRINPSTTYSISAYNKDTSSYQGLSINREDIADTIPIRKPGGAIEVGPPQNNEDATTKLYVDTKISEMAAQIGSGAPERYVRNILLSWREYIEGEGDVTRIDAPKYLELKPGMEFDLITYAEETDSVCPYIDLIGNYAPGADFSPYGAEYDGETDANPTGTHNGVLKYHVLVAKDPQTINGEVIDYLAPEITLYYKDGTFKQAFPNFQEVSGSDAPSLRQANLRLQLYGVPTYNSNIYYYGNTSPNISTSPIK